jgi:hypothetical protein
MGSGRVRRDHSAFGRSARGRSGREPRPSWATLGFSMRRESQTAHGSAYALSRPHGILRTPHMPVGHPDADDKTVMQSDRWGTSPWFAHDRSSPSADAARGTLGLIASPICGGNHRNKATCCAVPALSGNVFRIPDIDVLRCSSRRYHESCDNGLYSGRSKTFDGLEKLPAVRKNIERMLLPRKEYTTYGA